MIDLSPVLQAGNPEERVQFLKAAITTIDPGLLPLQKGLSQSSYVSDSPISPVILNISEAQGLLRVKAGINYFGVIAGSCCSDDPTPMSELPEYCELLFEIDGRSGAATVSLLSDQDYL